jgi:MoxR-like ATPase
MLDLLLVTKQYPLAATFGLNPAEVDPKLTVTGYEIPDPQSITHQDPQLQEQLQSHASLLRGLIPQADPYYRFRKELIRDLYTWWEGLDPDVLLLFGPTGAGKTSLFTEWCARLGTPLFSAKGHKDFREYEAFGCKELAGGETVFSPGPVTQAAQYGLPVIINEYDRIQPAKAIVFNDVFEGRSFMVPGNMGQPIVPQLGFRAVLTANTNLVEDLTGNYQTGGMQDTSVLERMYAVKVGYPSEEDEAQILMAALADFDDQLLAYWFDQEGLQVSTSTGMKQGASISRAEFVTGLLSVAKKIRDQSKDCDNATDAALERTMSTRMLRKWAVRSVRNAKAPEVMGLSGLHLALRRSLSSLATKSTSIALHEAITTVFGVRETV